MYLKKSVRAEKHGVERAQILRSGSNTCPALTIWGKSFKTSELQPFTYKRKGLKMIHKVPSGSKHLAYDRS